MDLNFQLMREQIALHWATSAPSAIRREGHRLDARMIRRVINHHFGARSPFPAVTA
ncbi:MAG: hypothetical protein M3Q19_00190 [Pseudomonadota bacterium]|nr:hypothetical protein [Pseudomonadota bacterium]